MSSNRTQNIGVKIDSRISLSGVTPDKRPAASSRQVRYIYHLANKLGKTVWQKEAELKPLSTRQAHEVIHGLLKKAEESSSALDFNDRELVEIIDTEESDAWQEYVRVPGFRIEPLHDSFVAVTAPAEVV